MASSPPQRPHQRFPAGVCTSNHVWVVLLHWLRRSLQVIALAGVALLCLAVASLPASPPLPDRADRQLLRIVVANLFYANPGHHELARQLVGVEPDIVAVIECTHQNVALEDFRRLGYRVGGFEFGQSLAQAFVLGAGLGGHGLDRLELLSVDQFHAVEHSLKLLAHPGVDLALEAGGHVDGAVGHLGEVVEQAVS